MSDAGHRGRRPSGAGGAAASRDRLLRMAAQVLAERGYGETRLGDVAKRAGLQSPAVYYHFRSRDELVAEVMREGQMRVRAHVQEAVDAATAEGAGRWLTKVEAAVAAHLRIQLELSHFAAAVTRNAGHVPATVRAALKEESEAYHDLWRRLLHAAQEAGELRPDVDLGIARMLVIGALNWSIEWWVPQRSVDELIETAQQLVHGALGVSAPAAHAR